MGQMDSKMKSGYEATFWQWKKKKKL